MERTFDVIKPNLYTNLGNIYFGIEEEALIPTATLMNSVISRQIGGLRVRGGELEVLEMGGISDSKKMVSLGEFLPALEISRFYGRESKREFILTGTGNFGVSWLIDASTSENKSEIRRWLGVNQGVNDPERCFKEFESKWGIVLDKEKTLAEHEKEIEKLKGEIPLNYAGLLVMRERPDLQEPHSSRKYVIGEICLTNLKEEGKDKLEKTKSELIEILKEKDGPILSLDAPDIFNQCGNLSRKMDELNQYSPDILLNPNWRSKLVLRS